MNFRTIIFLFAVTAIMLNACNNTTTNPVNPPAKPNPPSNLMATSLDSVSVKIKWSPSTSVNDSAFQGYIVDIAPGTFASKNVAKTDSTCTISGLTEGTVYTFTVHSANTNGDESTAGITVQWSPATRFTQNANDNPIYVYETASSFGSGLEFFDPNTGKPQVLTVTDGGLWNLALDTRNSILVIGSPSQINYNYGSTPPITQISDNYWDASDLNNIYDSQALDAGNFTETTIDLNALYPTLTNGLAIVARTHEGNSSSWTYAKILIKKGSSSFLQGSGGNRYIICEISYQKTPGVPYAM